MSNIITAGNATNNGTSISSDTSGVLELKTGSTPTTAIAVDASQNVGIGTSSPNTALSVRRGAGADAYIDIAGNNNTLGSTSFTIGQASDNLSYIYQRANAALIFATNNAERMRIDSSGNVGIGTASPQARLHQSSTNDGVQAIFTGAQTGTTQTILFRSQYQTNNGTAGFANIGWLDNGSQGGSLTLGTTSNGSGTTGIPTERIRIDSSGNLLVNNGSVYFTSAQYRSNVASSQLQFINNAAGVSLAVNGTSWGSLSDERDKEIIEPITNAVGKVSSLRSIIGRYKSDDAEKRRAFLIAQDVKAVLPEAVTELEDEKQTLVLQYTETIPLLVAAIQELKAELDATKAEVAALKGA